MPVVSRAQDRAMHAAKAGNSTLGIPAKVGADFVAASRGIDRSELPEEKGEPKKGHVREERKEHRGGQYNLKKQHRFARANR